MSRADEIFKANCRDILDSGVWDTDLAVRPHWEDGTPAHTVKKFGLVNRYNLQAEIKYCLQLQSMRQSILIANVGTVQIKPSVMIDRTKTRMRIRKYGNDGISCFLTRSPFFRCSICKGSTHSAHPDA